jgi:hypothetical protein
MSELFKQLKYVPEVLPWDGSVYCQFSILENRAVPLNFTISEIRFWCECKLIDIQRVKNSDLKGVHFSTLANSIGNARLWHNISGNTGKRKRDYDGSR